MSYDYEEIKKRSKKASFRNPGMIVPYSGSKHITKYSNVKTPAKKKSLAEKLQGGFNAIQGGISQVQDIADVISANVNFDAAMGTNVFEDTSFNQLAVEGGKPSSQGRNAKKRKSSRVRRKIVTEFYY